MLPAIPVKNQINGTAVPYTRFASTYSETSSAHAISCIAKRLNVTVHFLCAESLIRPGSGHILVIVQMDQFPVQFLGGMREMNGKNVCSVFEGVKRVAMRNPARLL